MKKRDRIYHRTDSGRKAWKNEKSELSPAHRKILGLIDHPVQSDEVISGLSPDSEEQVRAWLDELETLCLVACSYPTLAAAKPVRRQVLTSRHKRKPRPRK